MEIAKGSHGNTVPGSLKAFDRFIQDLSSKLWGTLAQRKVIKGVEYNILGIKLPAQPLGVLDELRYDTGLLLSVLGLDMKEDYHRVVHGLVQIDIGNIGKTLRCRLE